MPRTKRAVSTVSSQTTGCLLKIQDLYPRMTAKEKLIADYILRNGDVVYQSITEFVATSKAGYGSVIRFCKQLGYNGFQDFKIGLAEDLAVQKATESARHRDSLEAQAEAACQNIRRTAELIGRNDFAATAQALASAGSVLVIGCGRSAPAAKGVEFGLSGLGVLAVSVDDPQMQLVRAAALSDTDVAFLVSFSGTSKEIQAAGEVARGAGATVVCLTNSPTSPVCSIAHHKLVTGVRIDPGGEELTPQATTQFLVDTLLREVARLVEGSPNRGLRRRVAAVG